MKRMPVLDADRGSITAWFARWGELVGNVNFARVREMFVEDAIAFGSKVEMVTTRARPRTRPMARGVADHRGLPLRPGDAGDRGVARPADGDGRGDLPLDRPPPGRNAVRPAGPCHRDLDAGRRGRAVARHPHPCVAEARDAGALVWEPSGGGVSEPGRRAFASHRPAHSRARPHARSDEPARERQTDAIGATGRSLHSALPLNLNYEGSKMNKQEERDGLDDPDPGRDLHRTRDQRLPAGRVLIRRAAGPRGRPASTRDRQAVVCPCRGERRLAFF